MRSKNEILGAMTDSNGNVLRETDSTKLIIETLIDIRDLLSQEEKKSN